MTQRKKGQPKKNLVAKGYEPSPRDLEIYRELCKCRTLRDVAKDHDLSHPAVILIRDKVARHLAIQFQKEILAVKMRQTDTLDHVACEAMAGWEASKKPTITHRDTDAGQFPGETTTRKSNSGDAGFLSEIRGALSDIRKIWNIEKHFEQEGQDALNPSGIPREQYKLKIAQAQLTEAQELIAELQSQGVKIDG